MSRDHIIVCNDTRTQDDHHHVQVILYKQNKHTQSNQKKSAFQFMHVCVFVDALFEIVSDGKFGDYFHETLKPGHDKVI